MNSHVSQARVRQASGFTLLEIVFVLGMVAILVTGLTLSVGTVETEDRLRTASSDIEAMTKRARSIAVRQQRAYKVTISEGSIAMAPVYAQTETEDDFDGEENDVRKDFEDIIASEETDPEVQYEIKRWQSDEWQVIKDDQEAVLILDPTGLVEPISLRCSMGKSWLMQELHPLTGGVRDEEMNIEKE